MAPIKNWKCLIKELSKTNEKSFCRKLLINFYKLQFSIFSINISKVYTILLGIIIFKDAWIDYGQIFPLYSFIIRFILLNGPLLFFIGKSLNISLHWISYNNLAIFLFKIKCELIKIRFEKNHQRLTEKGWDKIDKN